MESFTIILKNDKLPSYRRMAVLILLLHLFYFIYSLTAMDSPSIFIKGIAVILLSLLFQFKVKKRKGIPFIPASIPFLFLSLVWFLLHNYWLGITLIVLAVLDHLAGRKILISFNKDRIKFHSIPGKMIRWDDLDNVVLKDRILTLDFRNDRLLQSEISPESFDIDEKAFTTFCHDQLENKV